MVKDDDKLIPELEDLMDDSDEEDPRDTCALEPLMARVDRGEPISASEYTMLMHLYPEKVEYLQESLFLVELDLEEDASEVTEFY